MPAGVYTGGGATVIMDPSPIVYVKVFRKGSTPDGWLQKKSHEVAFMARRIAPRRSGLLANSIRVEQNRGERGRFAFGYSVYTSIRYGGYVHEGTGPSVRATYPRKMSFMGTNAFAGQHILTPIVYHPGTPANPFLQRSLVALAT